METKTPTKTLKPFQLEDANQMRLIGNCVAGHEPGCGKTAIGISLIAGRTLIITPKSVLFQYAAEIQAFRPELSPTIVTGSPSARKKAFLSDLSPTAVLLCTYETLRSDVGIVAGLPTFQTIMFDEVHRLASIATKTHKMIRQLLKYYASDDRPQPKIFGFSASLIMNSPMDCFGIFNILKPQLFPNWRAFTSEYMVQHPVYGYSLGARTSSLSKLGQIIRPYVIKRTLSDVAPQLPPHTDQIVEFDLSPAELKLYNTIKKELIFDLIPKDVDLLKNPLSIQNALTKLQVLSQLTLSPALIGHSNIPSTKLSVLQEKVDELLTDNTRKCVVYSWFARRASDLMLPEFQKYNPAVIVGGQSQEERESQRVKFKTDPTCRLMLLSKAGSEGISLEEAQYLIRLDTPFSIGRDIQLSGRIRRITSEEPTFSFTLAARNSVDQRMLAILEKKKLMNSSIFSWQDVKDLIG